MGWVRFQWPWRGIPWRCRVELGARDDTGSGVTGDDRGEEALVLAVHVLLHSRVLLPRPEEDLFWVLLTTLRGPLEC